MRWAQKGLSFKHPSFRPTPYAYPLSRMAENLEIAYILWLHGGSITRNSKLRWQKTIP